jgi:hypothetical protein
VLDAAMAEARRLAELRTGAYAGTKQNLRAAAIAKILEELEPDMAGVDVPQV